jgi:sec-independent protein translocase protein TatA
MPIGPWELLIILAIVIAIFGAGRLAGIGSALGGSIREFKKAVRDDETAASSTDKAESEQKASSTQ